jgi:hypothetical protein
LVLVSVHESTTDPNGSIGDDSITPTLFGQAVSKDRFHVLLKKLPKHGVFAPIASRGSKGLQGLSELERRSRIGFLKKGEPFDRSRLTEGAPEFLSCHDPLELEKGDLDPWSFMDLSYPTSVSWSSNIRWKGYLTRSSTCRALELYENSRPADSEPGNEATLITPTTDKDATSRDMSRSGPEPLEEDISFPSALEELVKQGDYKEPTLDKPTSDGEDDPDRPKGTAEEQRKAYSLRNTDISSVLRDQIATENKLFRDVEDITTLTAEAERHARRTQLEYQDAIASGAGEHAVELFKKAADEALLDRDAKRRERDTMTALADDILAHPELRPRVPVGAEIDERKMTIINNATKSLRDRINSIAMQK